MKTLKLDISKAGVEITPRMEERTREALSLLLSLIHISEPTRP